MATWHITLSTGIRNVKTAFVTTMLIFNEISKLREWWNRILKGHMINRILHSLHFISNLSNALKARIINFIFNGHLFKILYVIVGQICEKIMHFIKKVWNLVHGQISNKQNFWGSVPRQKCILTAVILNFKMTTCFHVKPVKLYIILQ